MSGVDVLAVVGQSIGIINAQVPGTAKLIRDMHSARAAIAELIERADAVQAHFTPERLREDPKGRALIVSMFAALAAVSPK